MDFHNTSLLRLAHLFEIMVERCLYLKSTATSLGPLETVPVSVNLLSSFVLHRPPGISANCRNVVGTDLSRSPRLKYWPFTNQAQDAC